MFKSVEMNPAANMSRTKRDSFEIKALKLLENTSINPYSLRLVIRTRIEVFAFLRGHVIAT